LDCRRVDEKWFEQVSFYPSLLNFMLVDEGPGFDSLVRFVAWRGFEALLSAESALNTPGV